MWVRESLTVEDTGFTSFHDLRGSRAAFSWQPHIKPQGIIPVGLAWVDVFIPQIITMATGTYHLPPASHGVVGWRRIALTGALCRPLEIGKENFPMGRRRVLPGEKEGRDAG